MVKEYYVAYACKRKSDITISYGSTIYSTSKEEISLKELEEDMAKELKFEVVIILNILPSKLK